MLKTIINRVYSDYVMSSRLPEFENIIKAALLNGYKYVSLIEFYDLVVNGKLDTSANYFVHRHDIDTDTMTARQMFEIEKKYNVKSSYYFRLSTLDLDLMKEINAFGSEASYHFEELAQFCKDNRIRSKDLVAQRMDEIRTIFVTNFLRIEEETEKKIRSVVSHGDFVNRKMGIKNSIIINEAIRKELKIDVEGYDDILLKNYSVILSDTEYPVYYKPYSPFTAIERKYPVIYLLTHPRHWKTNFMINTQDNLKRLYEGIKYSL